MDTESPTPNPVPDEGSGTPVEPAAAEPAPADGPAPAAEAAAAVPPGSPPAPPTDTATAVEEPEQPPAPSNKRWYVVKIQSGREESIKEAIERRVKIEGLEEYFGQIIIPVEKVTEMRNGKRVVKERKLYPGYLMVEVEYNDRILYLFRETSGVGDFVGGSVNHPPPPMSDHEVEQMLGKQGQQKEGVIHRKPQYEKGDRVKVKDGTFAGMEGEVKDLIEAKGSVRVELTIFGRPVPVELEYWQVEAV
jgi:transcriptional antiterminator NusG